ncbi:MAG TPA: helix-turn-helix domain-containing protein, partial [Candidatus Nanoarchaeia archaeon]|nr:helix-turn-helix domain-containing protein [Candidatus Nanoarchaeia archaeon]
NSIGLGKNEAKVYLALLRKEASSVLEISKITKIHRSNIYDSLNNLINHGLVYEVNSDGRKLFYSRPLKSLLDYVKHKEIELEEIINNFEVLNPIERKVGLSKGKFALKQALMSLLEPGKPIVVYGIPNSAIETIGPILKEFHKERIKRKIPMRHIYNQNAQERIKQLNKMKYTEAKHLSEKYDSLVSTNLAGDKVILIIWDKELSVIEITDKNIAESYKNYSEILWSKARAD